MANKISISEIRSNYAKRIENRVRNFNSYVREIVNDWDALHVNELRAAAEAAEAAAKAAAKAAKAKDATSETRREAAEAKQQSEAAAARAAAAEAAAAIATSEAREELREICAKYNLKREDISLSFLKKFSFYANSNGVICDAKRVDIENESEMRAEFGKTYEFKENSKGVVYMLIPVKIWSAAKLLQKLTSAAAAREAAKKLQSALAREAQRAAAEAKRIAAYKARIAAYEAKQQSSKAAAEAQPQQQRSEAAEKSE